MLGKETIYVACMRGNMRMTTGAQICYLTDKQKRRAYIVKLNMFIISATCEVFGIECSYVDVQKQRHKIEQSRG